ncbi:MAG: hypothetical protein WD772_02915, partial [Pseudohongiellaceae bacterium]
DRFPGWETVNIDASFPLDPNLHGHKHRFGKTMPHRFFPDYDSYVYLDPKWEITREFLLRSKELLSKDSDWITCRHPDRQSFIAEILFPYYSGTLSFEEIVYLVNQLNAENVRFSTFFSSLTTWIVRKDTARTRQTGERWFDLLCKCYRNHVRDQIVFPFAVCSQSDIACDLSITDLYDTGVVLNYPNQVRTIAVDWATRYGELMAFLKKNIS